MHPILIATIALVGVPILLHLIMKQEPKRLLFPAIRFLEKRRKVNQRKMRLRHWLLLAMRMLLIGLFGLALFQPQLAGTLGGLNFGGEQPVAAVFILDTSPSMGYTANDRTRLSEARRRALELLDDLPSSSKIAILDPAEPGGNWELSVATARKKLEELKEPKGQSVPVTTAIAAAYQLLRTVDGEAESQEPMPRLVAVFSDRASNCWDATRTDDLKKLRETIPQPPVAHLFLDVGIDQPSNIAITNIEMKPQMIPEGAKVVLNATLTGAGPEVESTVKCKIVTADNLELKKIVKVPSGGTVGTSFEFESIKLKPGLHQVEISLETPDNLEFDNVRYFTFKVAQTRKILTITDDPRQATGWENAHDAFGEFAVDVQKPTDELPMLANYEAVCLLGVADPAPLWPKLQAYVEAGGQLAIALGKSPKREAYRSTNEAASRILPAFLVEKDAEIDTSERPLTDKRREGVSWLLDDAALRHPMLKPFREWKLRGDVDVIANPGRAFRYWAVQMAAEGTVVVFYDDEDDAKLRRPAIVERSLGTKRGRVLMLTTPLDALAKQDNWNNYWKLENGFSWPVVFPNVMMRYLCGDPTDANFNFTTGQPIAVPMPKGEIAKGTKLRIEGRGISGRDADIEIGEGQKELRLPPERTSTAGSFIVSLDAAKWRDGFSLNAPTDESNLAKLPEEAIESLLGPKSVVPLSKDVKLRDTLTTKFDQPLDLFPWLLLAILFLVVFEGLFANRFYRKPS